MKWDRRDIVVLVYAGLLAIAVLGVAGVDFGWFHIGSSAAKSGWVANYQTLITGVLAIVAAFIGASAVYHQTRTQEARDRERRQNKETATRARLPHLLNALHHYLVAVVDTMNVLNATAVNSVIPHGSVGFPELDPALIEEIASAIESSDLSAQSALKDILIGSQVISARNDSTTRSLNGPPHHLVTTSNLDADALYIGGVEARYYALYNYGRFIKNKTVPDYVTYGEALVALGIIGYNRQGDVGRTVSEPDKPFRFISDGG